MAWCHFPRRAVDCFAIPAEGQRFMNQSGKMIKNTQAQARARQPIRFCGRIAVCIVIAACISMSMADAQIYDALDAYPPRWQLDTSDCNARIIEHEHLVDGGVGGGGCESVTLTASHGSEALLAYRIEPVRAIDELTAKVSLMSIQSGQRIGMRVRFPYYRDPQTRKPMSVVIYGAPYERPGEYAEIGVGKIEREVRLKSIALRDEHGSQVDLRDPYVDAIVVNVFTAAGKMNVRLDELSVTGMVAFGDQGVVPDRHRETESGLRVSDQSEQQFRVPALELGGSALLPGAVLPGLGQTNDLRVDREAFPAGNVIRILQHNGEPLAWVRSLGFDAVLISKPLDAAILREASQSQMMIYAPPPTAPDPTLEPLLEPLIAWYIGAGTAMDRSRLDQATASITRIRGFPARWQRPIVAAPAESWPQYSKLLDAIVDDLPPRVRGLTASEELGETNAKDLHVGHRVQLGVGVASMPPHQATSQSEAIAQAIGALPSGIFRWQAMWVQTIRSLERVPTAILFRSSRSLVTGSELDSQRSMSLSYTNRMVAMIAPWIAGAQKSSQINVRGAPYRCGRVSSSGTEILLVTSTASRGDEVLAGDGQSIEIRLPPDIRLPLAWRLTHFSAERLPIKSTNNGSVIEIVSPDAAEIIVVSDDPTLGGKLGYSARRFAQRAATDRWMLTSEAIRKVNEFWTQAVNVGATTSEIPVDLITAATNTLDMAEPMYRAGDAESTLRMTRRADAWAMRVSWRLSEALMPGWPAPTSSPPIQSGMLPVQIAWAPLMGDEGWGIDRLASGGLDSVNVLSPGGWSLGKRDISRVESDVRWTERGRFDGAGALHLTAFSTLDTALPGGYEGTLAQLRSPEVRIPKGKAYRIDAMVRTIGFGDPHQGLLVYDSVGGQATGVLVRGGVDWTPVRLYRHASKEANVRVMFELLGAGEAIVDEVTVKLWEPKAPRPLPFVPIQANAGGEFKR